MNAGDRNSENGPAEDPDTGDPAAGSDDELVAPLKASGAEQARPTAGPAETTVARPARSSERAAEASRYPQHRAGSAASGGNARTIIVVVVLLVLVALVIQKSLSGNGKSKTLAPALATASVRSYPIVVSASGSVAPASAVSLNFTVTGQLTEVDAKIGQQVASGAVLAKVDDRLQVAEINEANAEIAAARTPQDAATARGALAKAQADQALTVLAAPAAGTVIAVNGQVGETVSNSPTASSVLPGTNGPLPAPTGTGVASLSGNRPLIELATGTGQVVGVTLSADEAPQISANQKCQLTSQTIIGLLLPCTVVARANEVTVVNGLPEYYATLMPTKADSRLLNGMPLDAAITVGTTSNVLAIPAVAVYQLDGTPHVDVWFKGRAVPTVVTVGAAGDDLIEVRSGLTSGQQVVVTTPTGLGAAAAGA